jgi:hypothetical protein
MIIIVTNRQDYTADFLILELQRRQIDYIRFNTEDYPHKVQVAWKITDGNLSGYFLFTKGRVDFSDMKSIWYRRPVPPVPSAEISGAVAQEFVVAESQAAIEGIWRTLDCFWVSHPDSLRKAEDKLFQLKLAASVGFSLWPTILTSDPDAAQAFYHNQDNEVIYKPLRRGRLIRDNTVSLIYTNPVDSSNAERFDQVKYAPAMFQRYVPKLAELRVTVIGSKVFAVEIHSQDNEISLHDWRRGETALLKHELHMLPRKIESQCIALVKALNLAFGAIDLILTPEGEYVFLEINPNGQWAWIQQLCPEIPLRETLTDLLITCDFNYV